MAANNDHKDRII